MLVTGTEGVLEKWIFRIVLFDTAGGVKPSFAIISSLTVVTNVVSRKLTVSTIPASNEEEYIKVC